jgi:hypothetical protein
MKRIFAILAVAVLGAWTAYAQTSASAQASGSAQARGSAQMNKSGAQANENVSGSASANATANNAGNNSENNAVNLSNGTKIDATLSNTLDARKVKNGDRVEARTADNIKQDGKVILKRGTRLEGHVTQAQVRAKGQEQSQLGIVFDRAILPNGQSMPLNATVQALAAAQSATTTGNGADDLAASTGGMASPSGATRGGGGLVGGVASTAGGATGAVMNTATSATAAAGGSINAATHSAGAMGGLTSTGRLATNSTGVFGLEGLSIDSAASSATQGSMIVSSTKNVRLESGTQLLLSAGAQAQ